MPLIHSSHVLRNSRVLVSARVTAALLQIRSGEAPENDNPRRDLGEPCRDTVHTFRTVSLLSELEFRR